MNKNVIRGYNYKTEKPAIIEIKKTLLSKNDYNNKQITIKSINETENSQLNNNGKIQELNKQDLKEAFKIVIEKEGIDIMNLKYTIDSVYDYLVKNNKSPKREDCLNKVKKFVEIFVHCLLNWKFPNLDKAFQFNENFVKILLKKHLFKFKYLRECKSVEEYKTQSNLQEKNYEIIFNVIKAIEYKYDINIVGIFSSIKETLNRAYTLNTIFIWLIKFIDYVICLYLGQNLVITFSQFFNKLVLKKEIEKFDKEHKCNISYYFAKEQSLVKNIVYVVENVIYNLINKENK